MEGVYLIAWALLSSNFIAILAQKLSLKWRKDQRQALSIWFWIGAVFGIPAIISLILIKKILRESDEECLNFNIRNTLLIKNSIVLFVILLVFHVILNTKIFGEYDDRTSKEKALDSYCERQGRSGCSDTAREIKRLTDR